LSGESLSNFSDVSSFCLLLNSMLYISLKIINIKSSVKNYHKYCIFILPYSITI
jgi:hypothetical protein